MAQNPPEETRASPTLFDPDAPSRGRKSRFAKPRSRTVFFRLSDDEFELLLRECEFRGARSISDLARTSVERLIASSPRFARRSIDDSLSALAAAISDVQELVQQIRTLLSSEGWQERVEQRTAESSHLPVETSGSE